MLHIYLRLIDEFTPSHVANTWLLLAWSFSIGEGAWRHFAKWNTRASCSSQVLWSHNETKRSNPRVCHHLLGVGRIHSRQRRKRDSEFLPTLIPCSELTGADRQWAARYHEGDVLHYTTGSKDLGIARGSYATLTSVDPEQNRLTVKRSDGQEVTYDPKRLQGVSAYQEIGRDFAKGDRLQFTAPSRDLGVANRDLGTIEKIHEGNVTARLDGKEQPAHFHVQQMRHFDHGYAVTSNSSQVSLRNACS